MRTHSTVCSAAFATVAAASFTCADVITVPDDFSTIQAAIDASKPGDEVIIADGTYTGEGNRNLSFGGKDIVVRSANGPVDCIIDGEELDRAFVFENGESAAAQVVGLTIYQARTPPTDLSDNHGGGILIESSHPTIQNCRFVDCRAWGDGGGLALFDSNSAVVGCLFYDCTAYEDLGGGVSVARGGGLAISGGTPAVLNCKFQQNHVCTSADFVQIAGAGMYVFESLPTISGCLFIENETPCGGDGTALAVTGELPHVILLYGSTFIRNISTPGQFGKKLTGAGPALTVDSFSPLLVIYTSFFCGNEPTDVDDDVTISSGNVFAEDCCADGDLDLDGDVDFQDLLALLEAWGPCTVCLADTDADGLVGFSELLALLAAWGTCE